MNAKNIQCKRLRFFKSRECNLKLHLTQFKEIQMIGMYLNQLQYKVIRLAQNSI